MRITIFLLLTSIAAYSQELIQTDFEKGYVKDGVKYSVWQYFNANKEVELAINHTTGRVLYVIKDTSDYIIFKDGQWTTSKLDIHPIPLEGSLNFFQAINAKIQYPPKDLLKKNMGKVIVNFM